MKSTRPPYLKHLFVCVNKREPGKTCCAAGGGEAIRDRLKAYVQANGLKGKVRISASGCQDLCAQGPNVMVYPDYRWYNHVNAEDVEQIIENELAPLVSRKSSDSPSHSSVKAFFFDLGNVLVRFDHRVAAEQIVTHAKASPEDLYRLFFESPLVLAHDEGRITTRAFYGQLKERIGLTLSYEQFVSVWNGIFEEDREMADLVRSLLPRYPCYLISNINRPHFDFCRKNYSVLDEMTGWVLSYEVGILKPHQAIYQRGLELAGLVPPEVFYIDDRADLVEAARGMGFQVHRFEGVDPLRAELQGRGLLL